jgi:hypothetical protein
MRKLVVDMREIICERAGESKLIGTQLWPEEAGKDAETDIRAI